MFKNDCLVTSVVGNIVSIESKFLPRGSLATNISIACNMSEKDGNGGFKTKTIYINASAYNLTAELLASFGKKGAKIILDDQPLVAGAKSGQFNILINEFLFAMGQNSKQDADVIRQQLKKGVIPVLLQKQPQQQQQVKPESEASKTHQQATSNNCGSFESQ